MPRRFLLILMIFTTCFLFFHPQQEARAFEPVSMIVLAPIAIQAAKILAPYVIRAVGNMGQVLLKASVEGLRSLVFLPCGLIESTLLAPFGTFRIGVRHLYRGFVSQAKMLGYILILPLSPFGVGTS